MKQTSSLFSLNIKDALKGFLLAIITAAVVGISKSLEAGSLPTMAELKTSALIGLAAGLSYLIKNFFTPAQLVQPVDGLSDPNKPQPKPGA